MSRKLDYNCNNILVSTINKRLSNTDSSLGSMCALIDQIYGTGISGLPAKSCCYVPYSDNTVGNFMTCLSNTALSMTGFFGIQTTGTCDTSTASCGGLAPNWGQISKEIWFKGYRSPQPLRVNFHNTLHFGFHVSI